MKMNKQKQHIRNLTTWYEENLMQLEYTFRKLAHSGGREVALGVQHCNITEWWKLRNAPKHATRWTPGLSVKSEINPNIMWKSDQNR